MPSLGSGGNYGGDDPSGGAGKAGGGYGMGDKSDGRGNTTSQNGYVYGPTGMLLGKPSLTGHGIMTTPAGWRAGIKGLTGTDRLKSIGLNDRAHPANRAYDNEKRGMRQQRTLARNAGALADMNHGAMLEDQTKRSQFMTAVQKGLLGKMREIDPSYKPQSTGNYFGGFAGKVFGDMGLFNDTNDIESVYETRQGLLDDGYIERTNPNSHFSPEQRAVRHHKIASRKMAGEMTPAMAMEKDLSALKSASHLNPYEKAEAWAAHQREDYDVYDDYMTDWKGGQSKFNAREAYSRAHTQPGMLSGVVDSVKGWVSDDKEQTEESSAYDKELAQIDQAIALSGQPMTPERMMSEYQVKGSGFASPVGMGIGMFSRPIAMNAGMLAYDQTSNPGVAMSVAQGTNSLANTVSETMQPVDYGDYSINADLGTSRFGKFASGGLDKFANAIPGAALSFAGVPVATQIGQSIGMMNTAANLDAIGLGVPHDKVYAERADYDSAESPYRQPQSGGVSASSTAPRLTWDQLMASSYATPWWAKATELLAQGFG